MKNACVDVEEYRPQSTPLDQGIDYPSLIIAHTQFPVAHDPPSLLDDVRGTYVSNIMLIKRDRLALLSTDERGDGFFWLFSMIMIAV